MVSCFKRKFFLGMFLGIFFASSPALALSVPKQQYVRVGLPLEFRDLQQKRHKLRAQIMQAERDFSLRDEQWKEEMQVFRQEKEKLARLQADERLTEARVLEEKLRVDQIRLRENYDLISREKERLREHHKSLHEIRYQVRDLALKHQENSSF